ncbi:MAG: OmpA family protein [Bdellovibrio sp.]
MRSLQSYLLAALMAAAIAGCASKPPQRETILSSANATDEIEKTEGMIKEAYDRQADVLSPDNFANATQALEKAKEKRRKGKANEDILNQVSYARGWLNEANEKSELAQTTMKGIADARAGALRAKANELKKKEWTKAEKDLQDVTSAIEKGNLTPADRRGSDLVKTYNELEKMAVAKTYLSAAEDNIVFAKKNGAEKKAPKVFSLASMKFENAMKLINSDPRNLPAIRRASEDATRESNHLADVLRKVISGNTEDIVLLNEKQQRQISSLSSEQTSTEEELQTSQEQLGQAEKAKQELTAKKAELEKAKRLSDAADEMRNKFKPNEAEVFTENGKVMVRLKALQFPSNQATLGPRSRALLNKVETALSGIDASKITVEGHTDSTGNFEKNKELSTKRAETVQNFLVSKGTVPENKVKAIGVGPEEPISDNGTPQGRAQNRRVDLVIETE